jgi:HSP20 family protein
MGFLRKLKESIAIETEKTEKPSIGRVKKRGQPKKIKVPKKEKWFESEGKLAVDLYKAGENLVIQSAIAGIRPEDLDITIQGDFVTIKGVRTKPTEEPETSYYYQECYWGPFSRQIVLPEEVDPSRAEASLKEGILTIKIPRLEKERERKIIVRE